MKKLVSLLIVLLVVMGVVSTVCATKSSELGSKLYEMGKPYGVSSTDKIKIDRYLADNPITDEQANKIIAKAEEIVAIFKAKGVTDYIKLSDAEADKIKSIANEAADIVGLTLKFKTREVEVYKNGKLIEAARYDGTKLVYTGNSVNVVLVVSSVLAIALGAGFIIRKKFANA